VRHANRLLEGIAYHPLMATASTSVTTFLLLEDNATAAACWRALRFPMRRIIWGRS
jgi:hypothetical protein